MRAIRRCAGAERRERDGEDAGGGGTGRREDWGLGGRGRKRGLLGDALAYCVCPTELRVSYCIACFLLNCVCPTVLRVSYCIACALESTSVLSVLAHVCACAAGRLCV